MAAARAAAVQSCAAAVAVASFPIPWQSMDYSALDPDRLRPLPSDEPRNHKDEGKKGKSYSHSYLAWTQFGITPVAIADGSLPCSVS